MYNSEAVQYSTLLLSYLNFDDIIYGSCDIFSQIENKYKDLLNNPKEEYLIQYTVIYTEYLDNNKFKYIGVDMKDNPNIHSVCIFRILKKIITKEVSNDFI